MELSRKTKLRRTTISSIICQIVTVICGFILPRLIIGTYGSEQNGIIQSISQFLSFITFLDLGVGTVVQSALYKPLASKDNIEISKIIISAQKFFRTLAIMLGVYVIILTFTYPLIADQDFGYLYSAAFVFVLGYGLFAQYYFGIVNSLLITADQKGYVTFNLSIVTIILNTIASVILIKVGASLLFLKAVVSLIFLIRPLYLTLYVKRHYQIDYKLKYEEEPIKQKWNGVAMHLSAVVLDNTDIIVLTLFSTLANVSIYSVYNMVVLGIKQLFLSATTGIRAMIGNLISTGEKEKLYNVFSWFDWIIHTGTVLLFTITGLLILPFVAVYTNGITDAKYVQPLFAVLIVAAHACHCLRIPYNNLILAAGHYKQTQSVFIVAALLNITISIIAVYFWGLVGVAIGTLISMTYQTIWMAIYSSRHIISWPVKLFVKQLFVDFITTATIISLSKILSIHLASFTYLSWFLMALQVGLLSVIAVFFVNYIFYRNKVKCLFVKIKLWN